MPAWPPNKRKVIQIAVASVSEGMATYPALYALCDDGTIWRKPSPGKPWERVTGVNSIRAANTTKEARNVAPE
jgi:hypothetical protein